MAMDLFLELEGIPGESATKGHEDWIEVTGVDWGMSQAAGPGHGGGVGGAGAGRVSFGPLTVRGHLDASTPLLLLTCARGTHVRRGVLEAVHAGAQPRVFAKWEFEDLTVANLSIAGEHDDPALGDSVSLNYARIRLTTYTQDPAGGAGQPVSGGWDIRAGRPW